MSRIWSAAMMTLACVAGALPLRCLGNPVSEHNMAAMAHSLNERDVAANYYRTLLANCPSANGKALEALRHARAVIESPQPGGSNKLVLPAGP